MKKLSISEVKQLLSTLSSQEDERFIELTHDPRKGVQQAISSWKNAQEKKEKRYQQFMLMNQHEQAAYRQGYSLIAGIDEVGRGPLAGPVVAAAVILPPHLEDIGLDDSKKLSAQQRESIAQRIYHSAQAIGIGIVPPERIDEINIYQATREAMLLAVQNLSIQPDYLLLDAMTIDSPIVQQSMIKGDASSVSIAAASIIAKQTRDALMEEYALQYPHYGFEKNAGYGTPLHLEALKQYGATPIHRKTFQPVPLYIRPHS